MARPVHYILIAADVSSDKDLSLSRLLCAQSKSAHYKKKYFSIITFFNLQINVTNVRPQHVSTVATPSTGKIGRQGFVYYWELLFFH